VDWDISSKFGLQIDFHHFEQMQSLNLNSEVDFRLYDRYLEKSTWRQKSANVCPTTMQYRRRMQNDMRNADADYTYTVGQNGNLK